MVNYRNAIFTFSAISTAAIVIACSGGAPDAQTPESSIARADATGDELFDGMVLPEVNCATCHVGGGRAPELFGRVDDLTDDEILTILQEGKGDMPSFRDKLLENEMEKIVQCLRARFGEPEEEEEGSDAQGAEPAGDENAEPTEAPADE